MHKSKKIFKKYTKKFKSTNKKYLKKHTKKVKSSNLVKRRKTLNKKHRAIISMKGGDHNDQDIATLEKILTAYGYNNEQIHFIINKFNIMSQQYPFIQLKPQILDYKYRNKKDFSNFGNLSPEEIAEGRSDIDRVLGIFEDEINNQQEGDTDSEVISLPSESTE